MNPNIPPKWYDPAVGLLVGAMLLLSTMENHSRVGRAVATGLVLALVAVGVQRRWLDARHLRRYLAPVAAVMLAILISCSLSVAPRFSFHTFSEQHLWFFPLLLAVGVWAAVRGNAHRVVLGLAVAGTFAAVAGVVLYHNADALKNAGWIDKTSDFVFTATDESGHIYRRAQGLLESYSRSSMMFTMAVPALIALAFVYIRRRIWWAVGIAVAALAVCAWYVLLTKARGGWLGIGVAGAITVVALRCRWYVYAAAIGAMALLMIALPQERARALTLVRDISNPDLLLSGRPELWREGVRPLRENLIFGVGYGGDIFETDEAKARGYALVTDRPQPDLHSFYLQTIGEVGLFGFFAYSWLLMLLLWDGCLYIYTYRQGVAAGPIVALASLAGVLVAGIVYYNNEEEVAHMLWTTWGLIVAAGVIAKRDSPAP